MTTDVYCVGCGKALNSKREKCGECGSSTCGGSKCLQKIDTESGVKTICVNCTSIELESYLEDSQSQDVEPS